MNMRTSMGYQILMRINVKMRVSKTEIITI